METLLQKLIQVYRKEVRLYREILILVRTQREEILSGASFAEINEGLRRKRELLLEIEELETGIRREKDLWQRRHRALDGEAAANLMVLLAVVTEAVEEILGLEKENEILLTTRRRHGLRPVTSVESASRSYRKQEIVKERS